MGCCAGDWGLHRKVVLIVLLFLALGAAAVTKAGGIAFVEGWEAPLDYLGRTARTREDRGSRGRIRQWRGHTPVGRCRVSWLGDCIGHVSRKERHGRFGRGVWRTPLVVSQVGSRRRLSWLRRGRGRSPSQSGSRCRLSWCVG